MASNYVISLYLYSLEGNKRLQQIGRKKGVVLPKRHNALITGNRFSFGCPWFNCVVSLHRSQTGLHPVDICFVNNFFSRRFGRLFILMPYFQSVSPGA